MGRSKEGTTTLCYLSHSSKACEDKNPYFNSTFSFKAIVKIDLESVPLHSCLQKYGFFD